MSRIDNAVNSFGGARDWASVGLALMSGGTSLVGSGLKKLLVHEDTSKTKQFLGGLALAMTGVGLPSAIGLWLTKAGQPAKADVRNQAQETVNNRYQ